MTPFDQDDKDGALPTRTDGWPSVSGRGVGHMGGCWRRGGGIARWQSIRKMSTPGARQLCERRHRRQPSGQTAQSGGATSATARRLPWSEPPPMG